MFLHSFILYGKQPLWGLRNRMFPDLPWPHWAQELWGHSLHWRLYMWWRLCPEQWGVCGYGTMWLYLQGLVLPAGPGVLPSRQVQAEMCMQREWKSAVWWWIHLQTKREVPGPEWSSGLFPWWQNILLSVRLWAYQSFDGKSFTVEGDCEYRLAETAQGKDEDMSFFSVLVKQLSSSEIVLTRRVEIQIEQTTITLLPGHIWEVQVMYLLQTIVLGDQ